MNLNLSARRARRSSHDDGFTLIELLVVVVILGILIAIAIPVYLNYRKSANDKSAQSDLRGTVASLEQCYGENNSVYPTTTIFTSGATAGSNGVVCAGRNGAVSTGTTLTYFVSGDSYILESTNANGSGKVYCYASAAGGGVKQANATLVTAYAATCPAP